MKTKHLKTASIQLAEEAVKVSFHDWEVTDLRAAKQLAEEICQICDEKRRPLIIDYTGFFCNLTPKAKKYLVTNKALFAKTSKHAFIADTLADHLEIKLFTQPYKNLKETKVFKKTEDAFNWVVTEKSLAL